MALSKEELDKLPTDQREARAFRDAEYTGESNVLEISATNMTIEGNDTSGYIGVDPVYQNYANETEKPLLSDEEAEIYELGAELDEQRAEEAEKALAAEAAEEPNHESGKIVYPDPPVEKTEDKAPAKKAPPKE